MQLHNQVPNFDKNCKIGTYVAYIENGLRMDCEWIANGLRMKKRNI
jgi:hypothetical protein